MRSSLQGSVELSKDTYSGEPALFQSLRVQFSKRSIISRCAPTTVAISLYGLDVSVHQHHKLLPAQNILDKKVCMHITYVVLNTFTVIVSTDNPVWGRTIMLLWLVRCLICCSLIFSGNGKRVENLVTYMTYRASTRIVIIRFQPYFSIQWDIRGLTLPGSGYIDNA